MRTRSVMVVVLLVLGLVYALRVRPYEGNPSALITIGAQWSRFHDLAASLPPGLVVLSQSHGYDGFSYYLQARDPFLQRDEWKDVKNQRLLYPLACFMASAGQVELIPLAMVLVNALAIILLALWLHTYLRHTQGPGWLAPWAALNAGLLGAFAHDLTEPLAVLMFIPALVAYQHHRLRSCLLWLGLSVLARESHAVLVGGLLLHAVITQRNLKWLALPGALVPWLAWGLWITPHLGLSPFAASAGSFGFPFLGFFEQLVSAYRDQGSTFWHREALLIPWMALLLMSSFLALMSWKKNKDAPSLLILLVVLQALLFQAPMWGGILTASRLQAAIFPLLVMAPASLRQGRCWIMVFWLSTSFSLLMILRSARLAPGLETYFLT
ncbi:MAG: hypothetical protein AB7F75_03250 [Planctomycetota bacterium]